MEFKTKTEDSGRKGSPDLQISDDFLHSLQNKELSTFTREGKKRLAKRLGAWYQSNLGKECDNIQKVNTLSEKLISAIFPDPIEGEYIVFINNYASYLILDCEYKKATEILEIWASKVRTREDIETSSLLICSYVELITRTATPSSAVSTVSSLSSEILTKALRMDWRELSRSTLRSICSIVLNNCKLKLAMYSQDLATQNEVKYLLDKVSSFNNVHEPDQAITLFTSKLHNLLHPAHSRHPSRLSATAGLAPILPSRIPLEDSADMRNLFLTSSLAAGLSQTSGTSVLPS